MPFNSDTYYANKYSRAAWDYLAQAREIKRRIAAGEKLPHAIAAQVESFAKLARSCMHLSISRRRVAAMGKRK
ncbi:hypothetical protein CK222_21625 [Mesorhizobium sp. WSM3866]|uniref:hypothetical protein n=1 Tax=Mesorhizobium sp. WSM3866 TaxID=422271 RepID=UPI000BAEAD5C|nr:hypothetical protein [Mesorhizobium sp. WSM3866]PBB41759.1 hypothetical protein CK222_21625 [Mesorhizobium sp. WSM3866]TIU88849.1 MAG: hypothetical protein E5W06_00340 [Mesorhizobium sp.]